MSWFLFIIAILVGIDAFGKVPKDGNMTDVVWAQLAVAFVLALVATIMWMKDENER